MPFSYGTTIDAGEATTNWSGDGSTTLTANSVIPVKQGTNCIHIEFTATGLRVITLNFPSSVDLTAEVISWWFFYVSGKGDQFLSANANSIRFRAYTTANGSGTAFAEWNLNGPQPDGDGHDSLNASWNFFFVSGNTPDATGAGGAPTYTNINSCQFVFDVIDINNSPGFGSDPLWFGIDFVKAGNKVEITGGTDVSPLDMDDVFTFLRGDNTDRVNFPDYGLMEKLGDTVICQCGFKVGDGSTLTYWRDENLVITLDQYSDQVDIGIEVSNNGNWRAGQKIVGADATYAIGGWTVVIPITNRDGTTGNNVSNIDIDGGVSFTNSAEIYGGRYYNFGDVLFGKAAGEAGTIECIRVDIDTPFNVEFRTAGTWRFCQFHDTTNPANIGSVHVAPAAWEQIDVFRNPEGLLFEDSFTIAGADPITSMFCGDNTTADASIRDPENVDFISGRVNPTKIERVV